MATVEGTVQEILVFKDYGWVRIEDSGGTTTKVILWSDYVEDYAPTARLVHGMWVSLLREAASAGGTVEAIYDSNGSTMEYLYWRP